MDELKTHRVVNHLDVTRYLIEMQENERRRLAREVHDVVSPNLVAVVINLGILESGIPLATLQYLGQRLRETSDLVRETNQRLRDICADLRPATLDYVGLSPTVQSYAEAFAQRTGIIVALSIVASEDRLPSDVEICLFRVVQEVLTNCAKHSKASEIILELDHTIEHAFLQIVDNGIGFDFDGLLAEGHTPGLGLLSMQERVEVVGGKFQLESQPGNGTRITVEL